TGGCASNDRRTSRSCKASGSKAPVPHPARPGGDVEQRKLAAHRVGGATMIDRHAMVFRDINGN
ncbi:MAG: hypothetical protein QOF31_3702, partial [Mycobacterium sp.]|nr:hypothetical protein [Mycobacterium sp.]